LIVLPAFDSRVAGSRVVQRLLLAVPHTAGPRTRRLIHAGWTPNPRSRPTRWRRPQPGVPAGGDHRQAGLRAVIPSVYGRDMARARPEAATSSLTSNDLRSWPVVIFDGDDTLWSTEPLYDDARAAAAAIVEQAGLDAGKWEDLEREIDVQNVQRFGLSSERFPTSCVEAYETLAKESHRPVDASVVERIRHAATSVFRRRAPLVPAARSTLERLRSRYRLVLLTQGDRAVQEKRIADSGLADLFERTEIVSQKTVDVLRRLLDELGADPAATWFVGNSIASDVNPAIGAGLHAVWVDAHVWEHERREDLLRSKLVHPAKQLEDVLREIPA